MTLTVTVDPAAVPSFPLERGRASERLARVLGRALRAEREQGRYDHVVALRPQRLGQRGTGLAQAGGRVLVLCGCKQSRLPLEGHDPPVNCLCRPLNIGCLGRILISMTPSSTTRLRDVAA